jgi:hypothetical protein
VATLSTLSNNSHGCLLGGYPGFCTPSILGIMEVPTRKGLPVTPLSSSRQYAPAAVHRSVVHAPVSVLALSRYGLRNDKCKLRPDHQCPDSYTSRHTNTGGPPILLSPDQFLSTPIQSFGHLPTHTKPSPPGSCTIHLDLLHPSRASPTETFVDPLLHHSPATRITSSNIT